MPPLSELDPTGRFSGLAGLYARCRPTYPAAAIDFVVRRTRLGPGSLLVDVGCGTGISARLFAERGVTVVGVEPNAAMRAQAGAVPSPPGTPAPRYADGTAEATGLADASADVVLAAQAFHWFRPEPALAEFRRVLKPGGWVVLMWNERDETDPFTAGYGAVVRTAKEANSVEMPRGRAGDPLLVSPLFERAERVTFGNEQELDEEGLLGRSFSASYAPKDPAEAALFAAALRAVFARFQREGKVLLRYETSVYLGRKPEGGG
jgi:SAM-dependent methyltransferase